MNWEPHWPSFRVRVLRDLREGWGVEDIAARRGVFVGDVRAAVAVLRLAGGLEQLRIQEEGAA